jgi:putative selenium metabolism protein SsnA
MAELIGPATVITQDENGHVLQDAGVVIGGSMILAAGPFADLQRAFPEAAWFDAGGRTLMPGLINAHAHFYGMFARGLSLKDPPPTTFRQVLERLWWRLDKALDLEGVYLSAALGGISAIRAGCTTVIDHHASPNCMDGSLDAVAQAAHDLGLRACLCYEVSDRDGPERAAAGIAENVRFARALGATGGGAGGTGAGGSAGGTRAGSSGGRLAAKFGLHASFTLEPETLARARRAEANLGTGFHIHCAEGPEDGADALARYGKPVVQRLHDEGILGERSILAHCVHVTEAEVALLAHSGTWVSHQPHSNMGNAVGWARLLAMAENGVSAALGTDGYTWDMFETMRTAAVLHSHETGVPGAGVGEFARILLRSNAALASQIFGRKLGVVEPGAAADLVLLDYHPPTPVTAGNLPWHLQFGMAAPQVHTVWIDGAKVLRDRQLPYAVDEQGLAARARQVAGPTWERF